MPNDEELQWMPGLVIEDQVFLKVEGIYHFIDKVIAKQNTPADEKAFLEKFKKSMQQFEGMILEAYRYKGKGVKPFEA